MLVRSVFVLFQLFIRLEGSTSSPRAKNGEAISYNDKYPLTDPLKLKKFRIAMIADLDKASKFGSEGKTMWRSYLKKGNLTYIPSQNKIDIEWESGSDSELQSDINEENRGMELSELVTFDGKLLTFDDRTGYIFDITNGSDPQKWIKLNENEKDDNNTKAKGFKSEWATVKGGSLYVGSMGREWKLDNGTVKHKYSMFVKKVSTTGKVESLDWIKNFEKLREVSYNITDKGYMTHESGVWSQADKRWVFLPRRCSKEDYDELKDGGNGCNLLITADNDFENIETVTLDPTNPKPTHGFSSFKFIPNTNIIVAIKTVELEGVTVELYGGTKQFGGQTETFIVAFDMKGNILYNETQVSDKVKYEGFEFI